MSAPFTDEQEELRRYARQWLQEHAPLEEVRRIMETEEGFDPASWKELGELGWLGMAIPEQFGGAGYGVAELAVLAEEMGRVLFPSPFLASIVMAASLVETLGGAVEGDELLGPIAAGRLRATVATPAGDEAVTAVRGDDGEWSLSGSCRFVIDGHTADLLLVVAATESDRRVMMVDGDGPGVLRRRLDVMDLTRPLASVQLDAAPARILGGDRAQADVAAALVEMEARAVAFLAMEQVGGAQACLDMSVEYAKERHQFGRPIGSFQAIKHMCADMLVRVESARSAAYHLVQALDGDPDEVALAAPVAKTFCSEAYFLVAADTIQVHGGIGFTWEHPAHLYLKRAKSSQLLFGDGASHRTALADRLAL